MKQLVQLINGNAMLEMSHIENAGVVVMRDDVGTRSQISWKSSDDVKGYSRRSSLMFVEPHYLATVSNYSHWKVQLKMRFAIVISLLLCNALNTEITDP